MGVPHKKKKKMALSRPDKKLLRVIFDFKIGVFSSTKNVAEKTSTHRHK